MLLIGWDRWGNIYLFMTGFSKKRKGMKRVKKGLVLGIFRAD